MSESGNAAAERIDLAGGSLRQHAARGTLVNGAFLIGLYTLGLLRGFIVAGILGAAEYGVWGIVMITFTTLLWLKQVGVVDRYVQQDEADQEAAFQRAFTVELIVTGAFMLLMLAAIPVVAVVYGHGELVAPSLVFVVAIAGSALQVPVWIYYRRMDFVRQRTLQAIDPVLGFVVTIGLAVAGAGYWSLVVGAAVGAWAAGAAVFASSPYRVRLRYDPGVLRQYVSFSWPLFAAAASSLVIAQSSILVGEQVLGLAGVGIIALASSISNYANRVDEMVTQTIYPAICAVRDRTDLLFETFVKSNRLALMWGLPFGVGVALFASDLVQFGIGERWRAGVGLIQVFGVIAGLAHIGFNWDAFYRARAETRPIAVWSFLCMLSFVAVAIPLLIADGLDGLAIGMAVMATVSLSLRMYYLGRLFPDFRIIRHIVRAVAPTIPATLAVLALRAVDGAHRTLAAALAELALYVIVTAVFTLLLERDLLREVVGYLRRPQVGTESRPLVGQSA
ncbi:MAG TPA: oligosaccharide flippase family protein [Solirubrobacteraceae bacterium]|nr:oligosaccharide flippase family protein [Solirubrobacteraceae bacterium]